MCYPLKTFAQTCAEVTWIRVKAYKHCMLTHLSPLFSLSSKARWSRWPERSSGPRQPSATILTIPPYGPPPTPCPRGTRGARWTHWPPVTYRRHRSVCLMQSIVQYIQNKNSCMELFFCILYQLPLVKVHSSEYCQQIVPYLCMKIASHWTPSNT